MFDQGYALLIGVDENKLPKLVLPTVKKDVAKLKEVLTHPERCAYPAANVRVLTGPDATRGNILDGLDWLNTEIARSPTRNHTVFIYYSGHGHHEPSGEAFLVPYDARVPIRLGGLAATDFAESIERIRPKRLLVVLDCCHAEAMQVKAVIDTGLVSKPITPDSDSLKSLSTGEGRAVLSSSRGTQYSWIRDDGEMSVFTYHLVEALTGHAGRPSWPDVTVTESMEYVGRMVPKTTIKQHSVVQEPVFRLSGTAFPIALILGGKGVQKDVAPDPLGTLPQVVHSTLDLDDVHGTATNVEVVELRSGRLDATTTAKTVRRGGKLTGVKIDKFGV